MLTLGNRAKSDVVRWHIWICLIEFCCSFLNLFDQPNGSVSSSIKQTSQEHTQAHDVEWPKKSPWWSVRSDLIPFPSMRNVWSEVWLWKMQSMSNWCGVYSKILETIFYVTGVSCGVFRILWDFVLLSAIRVGCNTFWCIESCCVPSLLVYIASSCIICWCESFSISYSKFTYSTHSIFLLLISWL